MSNLGNCSSGHFLPLSIQNFTLNARAINRGIYALLGGQPQGLRLTFESENVAMISSQDCTGDSATSNNITICLGQKGGFFDIDKSSTYVNAPDGGWNGTGPNPLDHGGHEEYGWDQATFSNDIIVHGVPVAVWSEPTSLNRSAFGIGPNSSTIKAFSKQKILTDYSNQVGIYMGSRSESQGEDGEVIFGGYDSARVNGSFTWFPIGSRFPGLNCPLQVLINDVTLHNSNGSSSLMQESSSMVPACIEPIQNAFTFSIEMWTEYASRAGHLSTQPTDGSPPYTEQTYPAASEPLIGSLSFALSNEQGDIYNTTIPHYEMYSHERGPDKNGIYSVTNNTRSMAAVASPATGILGVPVLGGVFLSQNYLLIDYERGVFGLAPAIIGEMDATQTRVVCSARVSAPVHKPVTSIILGVILGISLLVTLFLLFLWLRKSYKPSRSTRPHTANSSIQLGVIRDPIIRHEDGQSRITPPDSRNSRVPSPIGDYEPHVRNDYQSIPIETRHSRYSFERDEPRERRDVEYGGDEEAPAINPERDRVVNV